MSVEIQIVERDFDESHQIMVFALSEGEVVGTVVLLNSMPRWDELPLVCDRWVKQGFRRRGIGNTLIETIYEYCAREQFSKVYAIRDMSDARWDAWLEQHPGLQCTFVRHSGNIGKDIYKIHRGDG